MPLMPVMMVFSWLSDRYLNGEKIFFSYYRDMLTVPGMTSEEIIMNGLSKAGDLSSGGRHMSNHFAKLKWHIETVSSAGIVWCSCGRCSPWISLLQSKRSCTSKSWWSQQFRRVCCDKEAINGASNEKFSTRCFCFSGQRIRDFGSQKDQTEVNRKVK